MLYAVLCYNDESVTSSWSKEEDDRVMRDLSVVQRKYAESGKLGPVARLVPTTAAATLRHSAGETIVIDGPFAETKEQLLGFYLIDCASLDEALDFARDLSNANPSTGSYEVRPLALYKPGELPS
ncbi:YciI family protein [Sinorhizobium medicae]|uniref:YCII-related domain-containing protein n=2 Tax=Sinorhizobium medicae TaxID=110321 RepID=A0A508WN60_9HYPH|nr:YciI family protein [Sinorhizobium medicae]ABR58863.1 DGPFAETKE family protein [Sinorhizobium medicae WSM419]MBO1940730.1 YciI family protein [Sinorhizobium medicae]MBO1963973.1 YciI family protein [Sinorhizobium medicae]MDX0407242.1 YciI family protein [Sinorhizobium medicae]MDX0412787.1 YciI family protein [Sinorhizobium medicae]